jgi:transposase
MMDTTTGELVERRLKHGTGEAERFYAALVAPARVGIEATLATQWFEKMLGRYGHELWFGDAAEIRAAMVRKQKTDTRDALHILDLLMQDRFLRIWVPSPAERDVRQLVRHRHKLVRLRTSVMNQLHALAMRRSVPPEEALDHGGPSEAGKPGPSSLGQSPPAGTAPAARRLKFRRGNSGVAKGLRSRLAMPGV